VRGRLLAALGISAALAALAVWLSRPAPARPERARNLVLVSIDTLRADRLPFYGYHRQTAPGLASLAKQATLFRSAMACSSVTLPSHLTIMTGLHPLTHGVLANGQRASAQLLTLGEVLQGAGFSTAGFVGSSILDAATGMDQGFQVYRDDMDSYYQRGVYQGAEVPLNWRLALPFRGGYPIPAEDVVSSALKWLADYGKTPFFLFVHVYDPHSPYFPPAGYRRTFVTPGGDEIERLRDLYDCEIYYADKQLQRLWRALERRPLRDNTLVVVTSDHGEGLGEHQYLLHLLRVYEEELHVPLLMWGPGIPAEQVNEVVDLADLFPTLLELLGVPAPPNEGRSLVPLMQRQGGKLPRGFAYGQRMAVQYPIRSYLLDGIERAEPQALGFVRSDKFKLLAPSSGAATLFDLAADPDETRDIAQQRPELTRQYLRMLQQPLEKPLPALAPAPRVLTPQERERLRALGYLGQ